MGLEGRGGYTLGSATVVVRTNLTQTALSSLTPLMATCGQITALHSSVFITPRCLANPKLPSNHCAAAAAYLRFVLQMWKYEGSKTLSYYTRRRDTIRALSQASCN